MRSRRSVAALTVVALLAGSRAIATGREPALTAEEMKRFLLTARVVTSRESSKGVTRPFRLTLTDGTLTHDASFTYVDERKISMDFSRGGKELNFVDSYHYNIAGYELAVLLGLGDMVPVTVERTWRDKRGSLSWWIPAKMDEGQRLKQKISAPDPDAWNQQIYRMRLFTELIYDTDRNVGNMLITDDWRIWVIDFTRGFRRWTKIKSPNGLLRCDRRLLERLRTLTRDEVIAATRPHLSTWEIDALMTRRDLIVAHFDQLVARRGEAAVLY
jgi:hypothetical protein